MCRRTAALLLKIHPKKAEMRGDGDDDEDNESEFTNSKDVLKNDQVLA